MGEAAAAVQGAVAIEVIPQQRIAQIGEMGADLVGAACEKIHLQPAEGPIRGDDLITCDDLPGSGAGRGQHAHTGGLCVLDQIG